MLRKLIGVYRQFRRRRPVRAAKPCWRPAIEILESRLTPSASSVFAAWDASSAGLTQLTPVHVAGLADAGSAPQMVTLTQRLAPANQAALESLLTAPSEIEAKYPPYFFVNENSTTLAPHVEITRPAVDIVRLEIATPSPTSLATMPGAHMVPLGEASTAPPSAVATETPVSRRAAPVLAWVMSLSCLLLLRDPQRRRPTLSKAAASKGSSGLLDGNELRPQAHSS